METGKVLIYLKNKNRGLATITGTIDTVLLHDVDFELNTGDEIVFDVVRVEAGLLAKDVAIHTLD